jgi:hypothetical protein
MIMKHIFILSLLALVCVGCSKFHASDVRENYRKHSQFEVAENMQTVISNIIDKRDECRSRVLSEHLRVIDGAGEASIEYRDPENRISLLTFFHLSHFVLRAIGGQVCPVLCRSFSSASGCRNATQQFQYIFR